MHSGRLGEEGGGWYTSLPEKFPEVADFWGSVLKLCEFWAQLSKIVKASGVEGTDEISGELPKETGHPTSFPL